MSKDANSTYYDAGGIETLEIIKAKLTVEQYEGYLLGNVLKYSSRMMHKTPENPSRDAQKLAMYAKWLDESFDPKMAGAEGDSQLKPTKFQAWILGQIRDPLSGFNKLKSTQEANSKVEETNKRILTELGDKYFEPFAGNKPESR